jgi:tRNA1(Val) A37 N6-methylase TrmN6
MAPDPSSVDTTDDAVLGGRLRLRQPRRGHRVGHDAILLAAATPGRAGEQAFDLGAGVGAAGLALAKRVDGLLVTLIEIDASLCALAAENIQRNDLDGRADVRALDVATIGQREDVTRGRANRVLMNPPFNDTTRLQTSPEPARKLAHAASGDTLAVWVGAAAWLLAPGGTLTLIWRADELAQVLDTLTRGFGNASVLPVLPKAGAAPIRILVRAEKGGTAPPSQLAGLVLNDLDGRPTPAAEAILREGKTLPLADF